MAIQPGAYPLRFDVQYPEKLSRWLIFGKWILAIPHLLIISVLGNLQGVITIIAFFAILFTKKFPRALFDLYVNISRWMTNVGAYVSLQRDEYPPFGWEPGRYPVTYEVDYPQELSRWMIFVKWLLAIPHFVVLGFLYVAAFFVVIVAWFAILFTERYPRGLFDFSIGVTRWGFRVVAYAFLMRDEYPPFRLT